MKHKAIDFLAVGWALLLAEGSETEACSLLVKEGIKVCLKHYRHVGLKEDLPDIISRAEKGLKREPLSHPAQGSPSATQCLPGEHPWSTSHSACTAGVSKHLPDKPLFSPNVFSHRTQHSNKTGAVLFEAVMGTWRLCLSGGNSSKLQGTADTQPANLNPRAFKVAFECF